MPPVLPYVGFFPALRLTRNLELGDWIVGTPADDTPWASKDFKALSNALIRSFEKRRFFDGARLWHRSRGFDGALPEVDELKAIYAAVAFATLDVNDLVSPDDRAAQLATTENADLFLQPISETGHVTHQRPGFLRGESIFGWPIGKDPPPLADAVFPVRQPIPVSGKLAAAVYRFLRGQDADRERVESAIEWHRTAMANPQAVTLQQRLVALKIGFEAIFQSEKSRYCAEQLLALFKDRTGADLDLFPCGDLLWSPTEKTDLKWPYEFKGETKTGNGSELERWFMTLANARNDISHKGRLTITEYTDPDRPRSQYNGELFWTGERVLRETIKAKIGPPILLRCSFAKRDKRRAFLAEIGDDGADAAADGAASTPPPPAVEGPFRDLPALLAEIGCEAANQVGIDHSIDDSLWPAKVARATALPRIDSWVEFSGEGLVEITAKERDLLKAAGAEDLRPSLLYTDD